MGIASIHHLRHGLSGDVPQDNLLAHIFFELGASSLGTALLLGAVAALRNRIVQRKP